MNELLRAAILFNAAHVNVNIFKMLKESAEQGIYDLKDFFENSDLWDKIGLPAGAQKRLNELLSENDWPERELERAEKLGVKFINIYDKDYPARLREIYHAPIGLYVKGSVDLALLSVAIVGTRRCTQYGRNVATNLGRALARVGFTVVSGGARGIDAAGHRGCLAENGVTIAVLGTGIDIVYPSEHRELFDEISHRGALVSEYPIGTSGEPWRFPERNRIIMGLSGRTVIVESPVDGGAMGTANLALEAGREIWCVPGRINEDTCRGSNNLLRDGAHVLTDIGEFIQTISGKYSQLMIDFDSSQSTSTSSISSNKTSASSQQLSVPNLANLSKNDKDVLAILQQHDNMTFDDILSESGLGFAELQMCLITLSGENLVEQNMAGRYSALS